MTEFVSTKHESVGVYVYTCMCECECECVYVYINCSRKNIYYTYIRSSILWRERGFDWTSLVTNNYASVAFKQNFYLYKASIVMQVFSNNMYESKLSVVQSSESKLSVYNQGHLLFINRCPQSFISDVRIEINGI